MSRLSRTLVRNIFRVAKKYDNEPYLKVGLANPFIRKFKIYEKLSTRAGYEHKVHSKELNDLYKRISSLVYSDKNSEFYTDPVSFVSVTRTVLREIQQHVCLTCINSQFQDENTALDAAFFVLRVLNDNISKLETPVKTAPTVAPEFENEHVETTDSLEPGVLRMRIQTF
jgi:hypothetical protein